MTLSSSDLEVSRWLFEEEGFDPMREREIESLFTIGNGYLGTRASLEELSTHSEAGTFISGVFDTNPEDHTVLIVAPDWTWLEVCVAGERLAVENGALRFQRRSLDLRTGCYTREWIHEDTSGRLIRIQTRRFASLACPHLLYQEVTVSPENFQAEITVALGLNASSRPDRQHETLTVTHQGPIAGGGILQVAQTQNSGIVIALASRSAVEASDALPSPPSVVTGERQIQEVWHWQGRPGQAYRFHRMVAIVTTRETAEQDLEAATLAYLAEAQRQSPTGLWEAHCEAWEARWFLSDIRLTGDELAQRALLFGIYHLIIAANPGNPTASIGARTLSGTVYEGHIFWDTEIFILPFFIYTWPQAARALLLYRYNTLPAARRNAAEKGCPGALYPWESALSGEEETPPFVRLPGGKILRVLCGEMEEHIVADVAYAVWHYWQATGDAEFFQEYGVEMLLECARFWTCRMTLDPADDLYHIEHVIGPDEYHEDVRDNAFTNAMARWNLQAAVVAAQWLQNNAPAHWHRLQDAWGFSPEEMAQWETRIPLIFMPKTLDSLLIEQHQGFFQLEPVAEILGGNGGGNGALPLHILWEPEVIQRSQILKQADVLMLLYLLGSEFSEIQLRENFDYYEPRTVHGSSLSPAIHALLAARLGEMDTALRYLHQTASIDLNNPLGSAAGGIHAAAMGGLWQAVIHGFAGVQLAADHLVLRPQLPPPWRQLAFKLQWRGQCIAFQLENPPPAAIQEPQVQVFITGQRPVPLQLGDGAVFPLQPHIGYQSVFRQGAWQPWEPVNSHHPTPTALSP